MSPYHNFTLLNLKAPLQTQNTKHKTFKPPLTDQHASEQDGKPYILQLTAGKTIDDQMARGYTVASYIEFASMDDMRYYDNECLAHAMLKEIGPSLNMREPPTILCFEKSNLAAAQDSL